MTRRCWKWPLSVSFNYCMILLLPCLFQCSVVIIVLACMCLLSHGPVVYQRVVVVRTDYLLSLPSWRAAHIWRQNQLLPCLWGPLQGKGVWLLTWWALLVWAEVVLGWAFNRSCLSWHTFWKCVKQRINCGKAEEAATPAEKPGKLVLYSFYPSFFFQTFNFFSM